VGSGRVSDNRSHRHRRRRAADGVARQLRDDRESLDRLGRWSEEPWTIQEPTTDHIPIALTGADYSRVMPLATGEVEPDGIALTMILGSRGSRLARGDSMPRRAGFGRPGGEWSMAQVRGSLDLDDKRIGMWI
jgi:hypothetical protein